jgi:DNA modification methylase
MPEERVKVELTWPGKYTDSGQINLPPPNRGKFDPQLQPHPDSWRNALIEGDNYDILSSLLPTWAEKFDLIYIDPPFATGNDFKMKQTQPKRGKADAGPSNKKDSSSEEEGESLTDSQTESLEEAIAYRDKWGRGIDGYFTFIFPRLYLMHRLLRPNGTLYVHLNMRVGHYVKILLDEIFGRHNFRNELVWCYTGPTRKLFDFPDKHDVIFRYSKGESPTFNIDAIRVPYSENFMLRRKYKEGIGGIYAGKMDRPEGELDSYQKGKIPEDWWNDIPSGGQISRNELVGYPTQKPERLLERLIKVSSNPGDLVGDFFSGSGTTIAVADRLKRRWIGCDNSPLSIETIKTRLEKQTAKDSFQFYQFRKNQEY